LSGTITTNGHTQKVRVAAKGGFKQTKHVRRM